jgi:hypothetical protein
MAAEAEARRQLGPMAVVPMPQPGQVTLVVSDGGVFAHLIMPRPELEGAAADALAALDAAIKALRSGGGNLP